KERPSNRAEREGPEKFPSPPNPPAPSTCLPNSNVGRPTKRQTGRLGRGGRGAEQQVILKKPLLLRSLCLLRLQAPHLSAGRHSRGRPPARYIRYFPSSSGSRLSSHFWRRSLSTRSSAKSPVLAASITCSSTRIGERLRS